MMIRNVQWRKENQKGNEKRIEEEKEKKTNKIVTDIGNRDYQSSGTTIYKMCFYFILSYNYILISVG